MKLDVTFPKTIKNPARKVQQFDYSNGNPKCTMSDLDFVVCKDDKFIVIESKTKGTEIRPPQAKLLELVCSSKDSCAVVVEHGTSVKPVVELVDGWEQKVVKYYWNETWWDDQKGTTLKDFVNGFFREVWNYEEDIVK